MPDARESDVWPAGEVQEQSEMDSERTRELNSSESEPVLIWGASWHARVVAEIVDADPRFTLVGFLDDLALNPIAAALKGLPVFGGRDRLPLLRRRGVGTVALGFGNDSARLYLAEDLIAAGISLPALVHSSAVVSPSATIGPGSVIAAGAIVSAGAVVGRACIVNSGAVVDHDCQIQDGAHVGPGVRIGGLVTVGRCAWIGVGASIRDRVTIGPRALVGTGAAVVTDIPEATVAFGVPAKPVRPRRDEE